MSIAFDQEKTFSHIYRYVNGSFDITNYATSTAFDLFDDNAQVGDCIYFGRYNPSWSFHDLKFNIGTALMAMSITVVWEYKRGSSWVEIPNVTDGTNAFRNIGVNTVAFDIPQNFCYSSSNWYTYLTINGSRKYGFYVRCRITAISGITEGGRTQTDTVKYKDFTITATDETLNLATLQSVSDSGGWLARAGVPAIETLGVHTIIRPHLYFIGTTSFTEKNSSIELGEENYPAGWRNLGTGIIQLGERDVSGKGKNGCRLHMHTRFDSGYDYVYYVQAFASIIYRRTGRYGAFAMGKVFKFVDSVFISNDRWYLTSYLQAGSEWTRSVYADNDLLYLYSGNLSFDTFKSLDAWQGVLCGSGRPATFRNTDINGKKIMRYYTADIDLIDCTNIDTNNITSTAPNAYYPSLHVKVKYNGKLHIIDENNNSVEGATVTVWNAKNDVVFSIVTGADGLAEGIVTVYDKYWVRDEGWAEHNDDLNPFRMEVKKGNKKFTMDKFTIDAPVDWEIQLQSGGSINKSFSKKIKL